MKIFQRRSIAQGKQTGMQKKVLIRSVLYEGDNDGNKDGDDDGGGDNGKGPSPW